ncbi:hypothetical protein [Salininema proteolyticum]|uniref:DUF4878 domain-containing protein n=1 Tax=Salininema proteolyticum TaxID=1607685 RepID=A0ABV8TVU4_9ACTN
MSTTHQPTTDPAESRADSETGDAAGTDRVPRPRESAADSADDHLTDSDLRKLDDGLRPSNRLWTFAMVAAAILFAAALALVAMKFFVQFEAVSDTPENSVEEFLTELVDHQDPAAAAEWTCSEKASRDFDAAVADFGELARERNMEWGAVEETSRNLGEATVSAEFALDGAEPAAVEFSLIAEEGSPQWMVCGLTQ